MVKMVSPRINKITKEDKGFYSYLNNYCEHYCVCPYCGNKIYYLLFTEEYACPECHKLINPIDIVFKGSKKHDTSETV